MSYSEFRHPCCLMRGLWRSVCTGRNVSGHNFKEDDTPTPSNIQVLKCTSCGYTSTTWTWPEEDT